ncbi:hypothetical protein [Agromyces aureus]|uniref:Uncharacterized protein n=1 Tax=Agromyces aureus TaxID=453304 RepID=A0A191WEG5_9MICO|nr:hypothetical protein [Agromyces aureus]ANJ26670.1 hypothetical protein ATC03_08050 [Agromyces aureus]
MNQSAKSDTAVRRLAGASVTAIVLGAIVTLCGLVMDWGGFVGGMALGAGIGLVVVGAYLWGYANGIRRGGSRATWLPSRDAE